ncbi:hypothetical protein KZO01_00060 [Kurthia zopfii]|uniref:Uncharacterized protein n=1 Tax=Kurthia zopfii TaxID=1650 RepID=A0A8B4QBH1_9BACL|nr:hypothetical protein [Kurthia zopfii]PWI24089.1 hypothetical protein DF281_00915 [Kurthia zopfii]TDR44347.1 hypothetical protein DFR61_101186 [Kurthia zopfii]GEK29697.1 hypothetical protein KZO01_00060 [Kurthia zopfii]STX10047.1 Uncharacterised protein [Kurthia zopfii]
MKAKLHRIFSYGTLSIKFDADLTDGQALDDLFIVNNGQFDIPLKVVSANVSPIQPDILNIEFSKMFSYVAEHKFTPKQLHNMNEQILNSQNITFDYDQLPYVQNPLMNILFWETSMYHEMNDLDGKEFLYE